MKGFIFILFFVLIGCKNPEMSELGKLSEMRMEREEEIMRQEGQHIDYTDNLENELRGTETELRRMNKVNDSLLNQLYECQNKN